LRIENYGWRREATHLIENNSFLNQNLDFFAANQFLISDFTFLFDKHCLKKSVATQRIPKFSIFHFPFSIEVFNQC